MRLLISIGVAFVGLFLLPSFKVEPVNKSIKIATYNIHYDKKNDTVNSWESRNLILKQLLKTYDFDIFGTQEPYINQMQDMLSYLSDDYAYIGTTITGKSNVEWKLYNAIFYKKDRFEVLDEGIFWLSETPEVLNSKGWDAYSVRMCVWALFKDRVTGKRFYHFNAHFDHQGKIAREESAQLLVFKVKQIAGRDKVILTGDFNSGQWSEAYKTIASTKGIADSYNLTNHRENDTWSTYNNFEYTNEPTRNGKRIDHIFVKGGQVLSWKIANDSYEKKYPSDHFPVTIEWKL